jgi:hypothetical protein
MLGTPVPTRADLGTLRATLALGTATSAAIAAALPRRPETTRVAVHRLVARGLLVRHDGWPPAYSSAHSLDTLITLFLGDG